MFSPFDPLQFKILAENVCNKAKDYCPSECDLECIYRTIINRSYYASFLFARNWLESHEFKTVHPKHDKNNRTEHKQVIDELKEKGKEEASSKLLELKRIRKIADYHIGPSDSIKEYDAENSIKLANTVFNNIKKKEKKDNNKS